MRSLSQEKAAVQETIRELQSKLRASELQYQTCKAEKENGPHSKLSALLEEEQSQYQAELLQQNEKLVREHQANVRAIAWQTYNAFLKALRQAVDGSQDGFENTLHMMADWLQVYAKAKQAETKETALLEQKEAMYREKVEELKALQMTLDDQVSLVIPTLQREVDCAKSKLTQLTYQKWMYWGAAVLAVSAVIALPFLTVPLGVFEVVFLASMLVALTITSCCFYLALNSSWGARAAQKQYDDVLQKLTAENASVAELTKTLEDRMPKAKGELSRRMERMQRIKTDIADKEERAKGYYQKAQQLGLLFQPKSQPDNDENYGATFASWFGGLW